MVQTLSEGWEVMANNFGSNINSKDQEELILLETFLKISSPFLEVKVKNEEEQE